MKNQRTLFVSQLDRRYKVLQPAVSAGIPQQGWIRSLRMGLGISLEQIARRLGVTRQHIGQAEKREAEGAITLNSLREVANAMDMDLFYALVPKDGSLQQLIDRRARKLAEEIVLRTHQTMKLEGQAVSDERLRQAIEEQVGELRREMPKRLWD